jgi:hypothetical protein
VKKLRNFNLSKIFDSKIILISISAIVSLICTQVPLLNVFDYEYSVFISVLNYFLSAVTGFIFFRDKVSSLKNKIKKLLIVLFLINFIPVFFSFSHTLLFGVCSPWRGFSYFIVFTVPSSLIGFSTAVFANFQSRKFAVLIFLISTVFLFFMPLIEIFFFPQIYFYNPILTFFPGTIYDEDISVSFTIIAYKFLIVVFFAGILFLVYNKKLKKKYVILFIYFSATLFFLFKSSFGFQTSFSKIEQVLEGRYESNNFVIIYPEEISEKQLSYIIKLHEYELDNLLKEMQIKPKQKIISVLFRSQSEKRNIFGAGQADVSKPWMNQIYSEVDNIDKVLKHELVHILSAEFGWGILHLAKNFNPSMIEGLAMAYEDNYNDYDIDYLAFLIFQSKLNPPLENLFSGMNFFSHSSSLAYIYSGAFIKYLKNTYGNNKIKQLYHTLDFNKIYKKNVANLEKEFIKNLMDIGFQYNSAQANYYFGRQPILKKVCMRQSAILMKEANAMREKKDFSAAKKIYLQLFNSTHNIGALIGYVEIILSQKKYTQAERLISSEIENYSGNSNYYYLKYLLADIKLLLGKFAEANYIYNELLNNHISFVYDSFLRLRLELLGFNPDLAKEFLTDKEKRNEFLKRVFDKLNKHEIKDAYIIFAEESPLFYDLIKEHLINEFEVNDESSAQTAFMASKLFLKNSDFDFAKGFILKALNFVDKNKRQVYLEQLYRINWFIYQKEKNGKN